MPQGVKAELMRGVLLSRELRQQLRFAKRTVISGETSFHASGVVSYYFPPLKEGLPYPDSVPDWAEGVCDVEILAQKSHPYVHGQWSMVFRPSSTQSPRYVLRSEECKLDKYLLFTEKSPAFTVRARGRSLQETAYFMPIRDDGEESVYPMRLAWQYSGLPVYDRADSHIHDKLHMWLGAALSRARRLENENTGGGLLPAERLVAEFEMPIARRCLIIVQGGVQTFWGRRYGRNRWDQFYNDLDQPLAPEDKYATTNGVTILLGRSTNAWEVLTAHQLSFETAGIPREYVAMLWSRYGHQVDPDSIQYTRPDTNVACA